jgi:hypothetical protein
MRFRLLVGMMFVATFAVGAANAADPAECATKEKEYMDRLAGREMPSAQKQEYAAEINGAVQRCTAGESDAWEQIEGKLPKEG